MGGWKQGKCVAAAELILKVLTWQLFQVKNKIYENSLSHRILQVKAAGLVIPLSSSNRAKLFYVTDKEECVRNFILLQSYYPKQRIALLNSAKVMQVTNNKIYSEIKNKALLWQQTINKWDQCREDYSKEADRRDEISIINNLFMHCVVY